MPITFKRPLQTERPVIGVIVNNVGGYSRGVVRGVTSFAFARAWACRVQGVNDLDLTRHLADFDGLIVQAASPQQVRALAAARVPVVNVSSALPMTRFASVVSDDIAVGRLGADYFLQRGYRRFIFHAADDRAFVKLRHKGFSDRLSEAGEMCFVTTTPEALVSQLSQLQPPIAVMGSNDRAALIPLEACLTAGLKVPDDVAVLGVDNDDLVQSLAYPALSTINTARERIGFEAAAVLEKLMAGADVSPSPIFILPTGVITRRSTDVTALSDSDVATAVRYIHAHAGQPIGVPHVLAEVPLSRRQLERKFRQAMGHSILEELLRCRMDRARQLLTETELALPQIALASGFMSASYFSVVFRRQIGHTPGAYRAQYNRT